MANVALINESTTNLAGSATFTGPTREMFPPEGSNRPTKFRAMAVASHVSASNGFRIELSQNGTNWFTAAQTTTVANVASFLETAVVARYYRVVYVNAATLQTSFLINSAYEF